MPVTCGVPRCSWFWEAALGHVRVLMRLFELPTYTLDVGFCLSCYLARGVSFPESSHPTQLWGVAGAQLVLGGWSGIHHLLLIFFTHSLIHSSFGDAEQGRC